MVEKMVAQIDLMKNCLYVVKDGQVTKIDPPQTGHGEYTAVWKNGKVIDVIKSERIRI